MDLHSRWEGAWRSVGAAPEPSLYAKLFAAYREPHRHYHTLQHLEECFVQLDLLGSLAAHPGAVEIALWFHDAIYDPRGQDNEERSARWAQRSLAARAEQGKRVHALVMATRHEAMPQNIDEQVLVDVDLSILGAEPARFDEYEEQVRKEYAWVPLPIYRRERRRILAGLLARPGLYSTPLFVERYEQQARANLARALARL